LPVDVNGVYQDRSGYRTGLFPTATEKRPFKDPPLNVGKAVLRGEAAAEVAVRLT
jgi:hypothetical protein